ncbi:MFS transporter [Aphanothece hegewaldii CCALA 016]|uniref:MFS transporter n=1 Tax=Aphanothece hegewaldii CCALA 016 TaxID=2107694 RepID=A0A2T1LXF7_9CHRO|nr:MFS transporter [Aphanothece hegewaldii]PSF36793.1 MFS transporter [Aphanothece hegewaldii CCALA 016]
MITNQKKLRTLHPWFFIPTLYFAQGVPYILINSVSVIIYKSLGIDNATIALWTSLLYLPWVIKMFWSPLVEWYSTKRKWILVTQLAMMASLLLAALSFNLKNFFFPSLLIFTIGALISATYDIAADGFYLIALNPEQQAVFAGIRTIFYRGAVIFGSGFLVFFAGSLGVKIGNIALSWTISISLAALIFGVIFLYHQFVLPYPNEEHSSKKTTQKIPFLEILTSYFQQPKIASIIAFILLYRFGEAMLLKLVSPFLLDDLEAGGLGLSTADVGLVYGTFGVLSLIIGGILGGIIVAKYGLRRTIFPLALALHLPNIFFIYMAINQPPLSVVLLIVAIEQFGYGLGLTAFMIYLMKIAKEPYQTSYYAISTGIMALGMMIPGAISGYLQQQIGYKYFFIVVCALALVGIATIFFLPWDDEVKA